jgi:predicted transposase YdaD
MQQSVIYQEWREEFLQEGEEREARSLVLRLLARRIGEVTPEKRSQIQALSLPQLEALGEALLDFTKPTDLDEWMRSQNISTGESLS